MWGRGMAFPERIDICGYPYRIELTETASFHNGKFIDGAIAYHDLTIEIAAKQQPAFERATVMHEVLHGIAKHTGTKLTEYQIEALSYSLVRLLRDNPDLVTYLTEDI